MLLIVDGAINFFFKFPISLAFKSYKMVLLIIDSEHYCPKIWRNKGMFVGC